MKKPVNVIYPPINDEDVQAHGNSPARLAQLRREMPAQAVCRECAREYTTGGSDSLEHNCIECGWTFICAACLQHVVLESDNADDAFDMVRWFTSIKIQSRVHLVDCRLLKARAQHRGGAPS